MNLHLTSPRLVFEHLCLNLAASALSCFSRPITPLLNSTISNSFLFPSFPSGCITKCFKTVLYNTVLYNIYKCYKIGHNSYTGLFLWLLVSPPKRRRGRPTDPVWNGINEAYATYLAKDPPFTKDLFDNNIRGGQPEPPAGFPLIWRQSGSGLLLVKQPGSFGKAL